MSFRYSKTIIYSYNEVIEAIEEEIFFKGLRFRKITSVDDHGIYMTKGATKYYIGDFEVDMWSFNEDEGSFLIIDASVHHSDLKKGVGLF